MASIIALMIVALGLSACDIVPTDGPASGAYSGDAIEYVPADAQGEAAEAIPFVLVDLNYERTKLLEQQEIQQQFKGQFTDRYQAADIRIGLGDVLRVTVFESGAGGLFVPSEGTANSGHFVTIPDQEVDKTGSITVPYATSGKDGGVIHVLGRRPIDVQLEIEERLVNRAIEPQVVVSVVDRRSNRYSVMGDVERPGRFTVPQGGIRMLDAISEAGGSSAPEDQTLITLHRQGKWAKTMLSTVMDAPENNVFVFPGDVISLKHEKRHFNVIGATNGNARVAFDAAKVTLADALAQVGGVDMERADADTVVIYREESAKTLREMGAELSDPTLQEMAMIPTVYRVDLRDPKGYLLAQNMPVRDDDTIYVSNHPFIHVSKIISIVRDIFLIRFLLIEDDD